MDGIKIFKRVTRACAQRYARIKKHNTAQMFHMIKYTPYKNEHAHVGTLKIKKKIKINNI